MRKWELSEETKIAEGQLLDYVADLVDDADYAVIQELVVAYGAAVWGDATDDHAEASVV
jgi:hypothetical protein